MLSRVARNLSQGVRAPKAPLGVLGGKRSFTTLDQRGEDPSPLDVKYWTGKPAVNPDSIKIDLSK